MFAIPLRCRIAPAVLTVPPPATGIVPAAPRGRVPPAILKATVVGSLGIIAMIFVVGSLSIIAMILTAGTAASAVNLAAPLAFLPPDAQGTAMGEAFTALARGPAAAWWNPAALALGSGLRGTPYSRSDRLLPWNDARLEQFTAAWGGGGLGIGATWSRYEAFSSIPLEYDPEHTSWAERHGWRRQVATAGFGIDLSRFAVSLPRTARIALGASGRGYRDERSHAASSRHEGWDMDASAILTWRLTEPSRPDEEQGAPGITSDLGLGYVAMNALDREGETETGKLPLGRRDRASASLSLRIPVRWPIVRWINFAAAFERRGVFLLAGNDDRAVDHIGGEISLGGLLGLRAGHVRDPLSQGAGAQDRRTTWGVGIATPPGGPRGKWPGLTLDYADLGRRYPDGGNAKHVTISVRLR